MDDPRPDRVRNAEDTILELHAEIERLRGALAEAQMALEKIAGRREYEPEDYQLARLYKPADGAWTVDEYLADRTLNIFQDQQTGEKT